MTTHTKTTTREHQSRRYRITGRWLVVGLALSSMAVGCGYSGDSLHRKNIRSIHVEMFQSKEFRRGIEFQLTEALVKQIDRQTEYKNVQREKADTILSGEILQWQESSLGHDFTFALPRQTAATLAIRYRWQDMRTGKILVDQPRLITTVEYVRPAGETVYHARDDAVNKLARKVVASMETQW